MRNVFRNVTTALAIVLAAVCAAAQAQQQAPDSAPLPARMKLSQEQQFDCEVLAIEDEVVRFQANWLRGPGQALLSEIENLRFLPRTSETGQEKLTISNGDVIWGTIRGMTDEHITMDSSIMGELAVPRAVVTQIERFDSESVLIQSNFAHQNMGKWKPVEGQFSIENDRLVCKQDGAIAAQAEQGESFTVTYTVSSEQGDWDTTVLQLFRKRPRDSNGDSLSIATGTYSVSASYEFGGRYHEVIDKRTPGNMRRSDSATVHVTFEAGEKLLTVWLSGEKIGEANLPGDALEGKYVAMHMSRGQTMSEFRMMRGVHKPDEKNQISPRPQANVLQMRNGDRLSSTSVSLQERTVTAVLAHGELEMPLKHVSQIVFRTDGRERPRRNAGDAHILTAEGRLTAVPQELNEKHLVARSDYLGTVRIDRRALRVIDLHIYRSTLEQLRGVMGDDDGA